MLLALAAIVGVGAPGAEFTCTPTYVWSADGPIWCSEGMQFRLNGIVARQPDGSCAIRGGCPAMDGRKARDLLIRLLQAEHTEVLPSGHVRVLGAVPLRCTWRGIIANIGSASCTALARTNLVFPTGRDLACHLIYGHAAKEWRQQSKGTLRGCAKAAYVSA